MACALPDDITISKDGKRVYLACEGENPRQGVFVGGTGRACLCSMPSLSQAQQHSGAHSLSGGQGGCASRPGPILLIGTHTGQLYSSGLQTTLMTRRGLRAMVRVQAYACMCKCVRGSACKRACGVRPSNASLQGMRCPPSILLPLVAHPIGNPTNGTNPEGVIGVVRVEWDSAGKFVVSCAPRMHIGCCCRTAHAWSSTRATLATAVVQPMPGAAAGWPLQRPLWPAAAASLLLG